MVSKGRNRVSIILTASRWSQDFSFLFLMENSRYSTGLRERMREMECEASGQPQLLM
jgi:hypothetical protein